MPWLKKVKRFKLIKCPFCELRDLFGIIKEDNVHTTTCSNCKKVFSVSISNFAFNCEDMTYSHEPRTIRTTMNLD